MSEVVIRHAALDDAPALAELSGELGYPATPDEMRQRLPALLGATATVFVAEAEGRVVGWIGVNLEPALTHAPSAIINGLVVAADRRGSRVGAQLLAAAEAWAAAAGVDDIRVRSNVSRERAHRFYLREGYVERKRQAVFGKLLRRT
ncbi:MAG TPA: GNAT family N-acetyltransferase [Rudaea sp.]|nr:GNAT family N-acetyltransferase [Rudaea sp.]